MKYTLLEIVQEVLNEMDSDYVNDINDTVESQQVSFIARSCFNELISNRNWPHLKKLTQLEASNNNLRPNYLRIPEGTKQVEWVKYDKARKDGTRPLMQTIPFYTPEEFLRVTEARNLDNDNVQLVRDFSATPILVINDQPPSFWTTFDDEWLVFDSYDKAVDDTLQKQKTQALLYMEPKWDMTNEFVPDLPTEAFAAFVEEVKSTASLKLKQMPDSKAEQKAARQQRWLSRKAWRVEGDLRYPNFGRKGRR